MENFILASKSPRRGEILKSLGIKFEVQNSNADESIVSTAIPPSIYVQELALLKAAAVARKNMKRSDTIIIAADTVVVYKSRILGKPKSETDAFNILRSLAGKTHDVYTGYCIMRIADAYTVCNSARTEVTFKEISDEMIRRYIATGEPMDKAGAYGIQGKGRLLISKISGDYFNVMGLPVSDIYDTLAKEFAIDIL